jgi:GNAT superfamily N-acetyltransferase
MRYDENFYSYYLNYLGITSQDLDRKTSIIPCSQREKPLNNWYLQHLIVTNINNINVFSITPKLYEDFSDYIVSFKDMDTSNMFSVLKNFCDGRFENYSIRKMYRMTLDNTFKDLLLDTKVVKLTKEIFMNTLQNMNQNERDKIWLRKENEVNQGRQYVIMDNNKIVSYCKVSDIDYKGGNLTVYTDEKYRNMGYGKLVAVGAIKWCYVNGITPIYWVDEKNIASVALSKCLGFKIKSEEIVIGTKTY